MYFLPIGKDTIVVTTCTKPIALRSPSIVEGTEHFLDFLNKPSSIQRQSTWTKADFIKPTKELQGTESLNWSSRCLDHQVCPDGMKRSKKIIQLPKIIDLKKSYNWRGIILINSCNLESIFQIFYIASKKNKNCARGSTLGLEV